MSSQRELNIFSRLGNNVKRVSRGKGIPKNGEKHGKTGYEMFSMGYMILKVRESRIFSESNSRSDT